MSSASKDKQTEKQTNRQTRTDTMKTLPVPHMRKVKMEQKKRICNLDIEI